MIESIFGLIETQVSKMVGWVANIGAADNKDSWVERTFSRIEKWLGR